MNSLLSSLSRPFNRSPSVNSQKDAPMGESQRGSEQESDGFLLVGQTASERNTVYGHTFNSSGMDAPPSYEQMQASGFHGYSGHTGHSLAFQSPTLDVSQWRGATLIQACTLMDIRKLLLISQITFLQGIVSVL